MLNVVIVDGGLKVSKISYKESHSGISTIRDIEQKLDKTQKVITVGSDFLNSIDNFGSFPIHLKVDVEGLEEQVISQILINKFSKNIQTIFFEGDERCTDPELIYKLMRGQGFKSFTKIGQKKDSIHFAVFAKR